MYESFYQLACAPFENTPDSRFFFASAQHREALAAVEYMIRTRKGFVLISGKVGTGKTTVGQVMRDRCGDTATIVQITYGCRDRIELLRQIHRTIGTTLRGNEDHSEMVELLHAYLLRQVDQSRPVVLFADEAQTFSDEALDELRLLSNLDTANVRTIQIVLVGQPEIRERLRDPRLAALRQRIVLASTIEPLNRKETAAYIDHRIRVASADVERAAPIFTPGAITALHEYTSGLPRLINIACDNCLLMGCVRKRPQINATIVQKVRAEMIPSFEPARIEPIFRPQLAMAGSY